MIFPSVRPYTIRRQGGGSGSPVARPLVGQVRVLNGSFADALGPRSPRFCSMFVLFWLFKYDRDEFFRVLDVIARYWLGIRVFTAVGGYEGYWGDRQVVPVTFTNDVKHVLLAWSDYDEVYVGVLNACRDRGLKLHITTGDNQYIFPRVEQRIAFAQREARLIRDSGNVETIWLKEVVNEGYVNGLWDADEARLIRNAFHEICPEILTALSAPGLGEDPFTEAGWINWSDGAEVTTIHGMRDRYGAAARAFTLPYWARANGIWKPFLQGEWTGPNTPVQMPNGPGGVSGYAENDPRYLFPIYTTAVMSGQALNYFNGPSIAYRDYKAWPLECTWGFKELQPIWDEAIPEDIGQWSNILHGNRDDAMISAPSFADEGTGPARCDQVFNDTEIVAIPHTGKGPWNLFTRRSLASWRIFSEEGLWREGSGPLPSMDASMISRLIRGVFA